MNNVNLSRGIVESPRWCLCSIDIAKQQGVATVVPQLSPDGGGPPFWPRTALQRVLVGDFNHLEKYEFVNRKDDIPYMKWKIIQIFETTNQATIPSFIHLPAENRISGPPKKSTAIFHLPKLWSRMDWKIPPSILVFRASLASPDSKQEKFSNFRRNSEYPQTQVVPLCSLKIAQLLVEITPISLG